jgi:hypothetical protein
VILQYISIDEQIDDILRDKLRLMDKVCILERQAETYGDNSLG